MSGAKRTQSNLRTTLMIIGAVFVLVFLPTLIFLATDRDVAAAITGTLTLGTILAFTHVLAFTAGAWYTRSAMQMGADVALRAQETNDRWDERKTVAFGRLMQEGARIGRMAGGGQEDVIPLPLPSQGMDWLPPTTTFPNEIEAPGRTDIIE
jgi:hypothetical protein